MPTLRLLERYRLPALLGAIALLVAVGTSMLWGVRTFEQSANWVSHTHQVIGQIELVRASVRTVESAARGYRLSGKTGLDTEYLTSRPEAVQHATDLVALVADNPAQEQRARELLRLVNDRLAEIDRTVALYNAGKGNEAVEAMRRGVGVRLMTQLDDQAHAMREVEESLLTERRVANAKLSAMLLAFIVGGMVVSLGLLVWLMRSVARENHRARSLEQEARGAVGRMEALLVQRERLAEQRRVLGTFAGLLHSCQSMDEAMRITANALAQLVPGGGGTCYLMRASQNLLEPTVTFGMAGPSRRDPMRPEHCWALRRGLPHRHDPFSPTACCEHLLADDAGDGGVCVPLVAQGTPFGLLHVTGRHGAAHGEGEMASIEALAEHLSLTLHNLQLRETLRIQSLRDPLTGLHNRRYLEENLTREIERCERRTMPLSVLMLDVDHFKRFNDEHGHGGGDALLAKVGQTLAAVTRGEDITCRYGGEEFTIVMPEASLEQATQRAEQIRAAIERTTVPYMRRELGPVTVSIGVATLDGRADTPETLLAAADSALYLAKAQGRNRVLASPAETVA